MSPLEQIKSRIEAAVPGVRLTLLINDSPCAQHSLLVDDEHGVAVATFLRDDSQLCLDYASNVTGVDWPERVERSKVKVKRVVEGQEREFEETREKVIPGFLEAVYHLYSMEKRHGPVILRLRTEDRADGVHLPSLTPVWRGCEFQEREVYDLFGIIFDGHPDLRRILMWEEFQDHPMRKDYTEPDDYEWEPTPHGKILGKTQQHSRRGDRP